VNDVARGTLDRNQHATLTTLFDLQAIAVEFYNSRAAIISATIGCPEERVYQLAVLIRQFDGRGKCNGVRVEVIVPRYRYRQQHFRFRYTAAGKQVSEAVARALVEG
jgi:hypothetical protein